MPEAIDRRSRGSTSRAASPAISSRAEPREQTTGRPAVMASATGRPKPSSREGSTSSGGGGHERAQVARRAGSRWRGSAGPRSVPPWAQCGARAHEDEGGQAAAMAGEAQVGHGEVAQVLALVVAAHVQDGAAGQAVAREDGVHLVVGRGLPEDRIDPVGRDRELRLGHVEQPPDLARGELGPAHDPVGPPHVIADQGHVVAADLRLAPSPGS